MFEKSRLAGMAAAILALAAAGCGGGSDDSLSKREVIARGGVVCKAAERKVAKLPAVSVEHPFAKGTSAAVRRTARRWLAGYADALEFSRVGLAQLKAPAEDKPLLDGYLRDTGAVVAQLRTASKAPARLVESQANAAFGLFERASRQTARYGFPKGVCGAGQG
jgi:hypothetical protein